MAVITSAMEKYRIAICTLLAVLAVMLMVIFCSMLMCYSE